MNSLFLKTYFYVLITLSIIFTLLRSFVDLHEVYTTITYHTNVIPAVLITGMFAFLCFLSLIITGVCVRKWGNTPMRFSWINFVFFVLLLLLSVLIALEQSPTETPFVDYATECYSDLIVLAASCVIAVTLASGVGYIVRQAKNQPTEEVGIFKNWHSIFMLLTLLTSLVYLLIGVLCVGRGFKYGTSLFYVLFIGGTILVASLITALLSVSGSVLMEKSKPMAFIMGIFTTIVFLVPHGWCIYNTIDSVSYMQIGMPKPDYFGATYQTNKPEKGTADDTYIDEEEEEDMTDEEVPGEEAYYDVEALCEVASRQEFNPLWYDSESPEDSIISTLRGMRLMLHPGTLIYHLNFPYLENNDPEKWSNNFFIESDDEIIYLKACRYISQNRLEVPLESMIAMYAPFIKSIITESTFKEEGAGRVINWLNYAFRDINGSTEGEDYSLKFGQIYDIMSEDLSEDPDRYSKYYNKLVEIINLPPADSEDCIFSFSEYQQDISEESVVWAYSFWARRWKEGTIPKARRVIEAIEELYMRDK